MADMSKPPENRVVSSKPAKYRELRQGTASLPQAEWQAWHDRIVQQGKEWRAAGMIAAADAMDEEALLVIALRAEMEEAKPCAN